jgi:hypothetical protein
MKATCRIIMLAVTMLCYVHGAVAQSKNRLDIILEGPWIIYSGQLQQNSTSMASTPVVIALAPGVGRVKEDNIHFHVPFISTGDGYPIGRNGVYCLMFDSKCAPAGSSTALTLGDYPTTAQPLSVKPKSSGTPWDWKSAYSRGYYVTVLILPMPDSYSTDGVWSMRFGSKWKNYIGDNQVSIGIQLHYNTGPSSFALADCTSATTIDGCNSNLQSGTQLNNYGTLSVTMKSPYNDDPCDPHVRAAYPQMLKLLDDTDPLTGNNANQPIAYIDPAPELDSAGHGKYDDVTHPKYNCYDSDQQNPQNGGWTEASLKVKRKNGAMKSRAINGHHLTAIQSSQMKPQLLPTQLQNFDTILEKLQSQEIQPLSKEDLLKLSVPELKETIDPSKLNPKFPRVSQTEALKKLLPHSADAAKRLSTTTLQADSKDLKEFAAQAIALSTAIAADTPSKDGKDCRAPLMLVQP